MNLQTGDILFTSRKPEIGEPKTYVAFAINLIQTKKIHNLDRIPTHTAQVIVLYGVVYVIDSDVKGVILQPYEKWAKGRSFIIVYRPNVLLSIKGVDTYIKEALELSGNRYGFKSAGHLALFLMTGRKNAKATSDINKIACSIYTAYLYRAFIPDIFQSPISLFNNCKLKKGEKGKYFIDGYFVDL